MRHVLHGFAAALLVLLIACGTTQAGPTPTVSPTAAAPTATPAPFADSEAARLDIFEAVYRWQFGNNASAAKQTAPVYFLAITPPAQYPTPWATWASGQADPPDALLVRFSAFDKPVKKVSAAAEGEHGRIVDKESRQPGLLFRVDTMRQLPNGNAEVKGGYYEAMLSASANLYEVALQNGTWVVVKDTLQFLS